MDELTVYEQMFLFSDDKGSSIAEYLSRYDAHLKDFQGEIKTIKLLVNLFI